MAIPILTVAQTRALEKAADASGLSYAEMMLRAGTALAERALAHADGKKGAAFLFLIGPGNNGGDGLVAARVLREWGVEAVHACLLRARQDALAAAARKAGVDIFLADESGMNQLRQRARAAAVIVDALFGIGFRPPLPLLARRVLQVVRQTIQERRAVPPATIEPAGPTPPPPHLPRVTAADCPSGLAADEGLLAEGALAADETVTFLAPKAGFYQEGAAAACGSLRVATLGVPAALVAGISSPWQLVDGSLARTQLPARSEFSHKGSHGRLLVVAGCAAYIGAVALTARAASRSGAGLVQIATPASVRERLAGHLPEATWLPLTERDCLSPASASAILQAAEDAAAIVIGPGWGQARETGALLAELLAAPLPPALLDADALNLLAKLENWPERLPANAILTPHPREFSRLCGRSVREVQAERWQLAAARAREWGITLLLKGAHSVIASPTTPLAVLPFRVDALATAGTGDVLSGMIGALLAGGSDTRGAAIAGGYAHALAGQIAARRQHSARAVIASDVIEALGESFAQLESASG